LIPIGLSIYRDPVLLPFSVRNRKKERRKGQCTRE
jgi:hypothetical protein